MNRLYSSVALLISLWLLYGLENTWHMPLKVQCTVLLFYYDFIINGKDLIYAYTVFLSHAMTVFMASAPKGKSVHIK